uniref:calpain-15-like isoform X1 n=1 Tax=Styela clava TaxID=7725 RepID=UPI001939CF6F|nr:calpain-15-like isoform X1 [Styela clava]
MEDEEKSSEWQCEKCTHKNHRIDKKCQQCRSPREISYPNIPEDLPIPEVKHPFPVREFTTSSSTSNSAVSSRKEVPPDRTLRTKSSNELNPGARDFTPGLPNNPLRTLFSSPNIFQNDPKNQTFVPILSTRDPKHPKMDKTNTSVAIDLTNVAECSPLTSQITFEPILTKNQNPNSESCIIDLTPTKQIDQNYVASSSNFNPTNTQINRTQMFITDEKSGNSNRKYIPSEMKKSQSSSSIGDNSIADFMAQSISGFKKQDFPIMTSPSPQLHHNNSDDEEIYGGQQRLQENLRNEQNKSPMDLTVAKKSENETNLSQNSSNQDMDVENVLEPRGEHNPINFEVRSPLPNPLLSNIGDGQKKSSGAIGSVLSLGGSEGSFQVFRSPGLSDQFQAVGESPEGGDSNKTTIVSHSSPGIISTVELHSGDNGRKQDPSVLLSGQILQSTGTNSGNVGSETGQKLKKIMPVKSKNPMPILNTNPRSQKQSLSNYQILSLYGGDPDNQESSMDIASFHSATAVTPGVSSRTESLKIDDNFDPYAPKTQIEPLEFKDEHFPVEETPQSQRDPNITEGSQEPPASGSSSTASSVPSGGARRKTPRSILPSQPGSSNSVPGTSRGGPPDPGDMLISSTTIEIKWACPQCTYHNERTAQYCVICHDGRPPWYPNDPPTLPGEPPPSSSQKKEFPNDKILHQTEARVKSKAFVDDWTCQQCTTSNNPGLTYCGICGNPRPDGMVAPIPPTLLTKLEREPKPRSRPQVQALSQAPSTSGLPSTRMSLRERISTLSTSSLESTDLNATFKVESIMMEQLRLKQENDANKIFEGIIEYCRMADDKFVDDQFRPSHEILHYPNSQYNHQAVWLRPHQINCRDPQYEHRQWTVFCTEGPETTDIQQGILGNCWFLSGLSVLVERPDLLRNIFITREYSKYGAYMIRLCKDGIWQSLFIDDLLPCNMHGELLYTQARRKQLWVPLIEKALAKVHGCYEALQAGRSIEGLATLTGAPCESLQLVVGPDMIEPEPDLIWVRLLSSKEAGFLMGASCGGANMEVDEDMYDRVDLRVRHAYSVLDVRNERMDNGGNVKLLQLRNPWAQQSWSGDWSDNSEMWYDNPRLQERLNPTQSYHGIFWLCFDDMLRYFDSVDICKIRDTNWAETRISGEFPDSASQPPASYFLEVYQSTEIDLSIFQQGSRSQETSGRHPVDICVCVFRSSEQAATSDPHSEVVLGPLVACSRRQVKRHGSCSQFLEPGIYQIVTLGFNHWRSAYGITGAAAAAAALRDPEHPKFVLALHTSRPISLSHFPANPTLFADATIELVMKKGEKKDVRDCATCYYLTRGWAGLVVVAENRHPTRHMQIVCDCMDSRNVVSTRGVNKTSDSVPPLHKQVLIVLTQLDGHSGFTITHKLIHRMGSAGLAEWSTVKGNHDPLLDADVIALHKPRPL